MGSRADDDQVKRRAAAEPDRLVKAPVWTGFDGLIDACAHRRKLRANFMNAEAQPAAGGLLEECCALAAAAC